MAVVPTTELEAVNECLENIGNAPVSTIAGTLGVDTQTAFNFVRKITRELQTQGWYWNTDYEYPITPDGAGDILIPSNALSIDTDGFSINRDLVQRGDRMYDRENRTFDFTGETNLTFKVVWGFDFEELPESARRYISLRAARQFQNRIESREDEGDVTDEQTAMAALVADQLRVEDPNALTDNYSTAMTLRRHAFGYTYRY